MAQYGSLFNRLMDNTEAPADPQVGDGATILMWSDRHAATVIEVERFKSGQRAGQVSRVTVQRDHATRTDNHGMGDSQSYTYQRDPNGSVHVYRVTKDGRFPGLLLGHRDEHYDFSF